VTDFLRGDGPPEPPRRPLRAVLLRDAVADADQLAGPLAKALDGTGPAILPLDATLPAPRLRQLTDAITPGAGVAEDTAVVIATSGSTGEPKGVELSAAALCHSARASLARLGAAPGGHAGGWLCCLPVTHVAGLQVLVRSLLSSSERTVAPTLTATALSESGCSYVSVVPTQLVRLLDEPGGAAALAEFAAVLVGGAAAAAGLLSRARAAGVRAVTTYGMSETCGGCVYDGVPLDGVTVRAAGDGLLRISGPVLMNRYRGGPDLGDEFVTSDLGYVRDGRVVVRGRADDVINTGGHKVVPGEVAAVLESCPGVLEVVVVGRADPEWGQRVMAVVVPADPADPPSLELLRTHVSERLPRYACPSEVVLTRAIPVLASGKPDLASLKAAGTLREREQSPALSVN
jgi:o-succinylbenzoate---CoA ligase